MSCSVKDEITVAGQRRTFTGFAWSQKWFQPSHPGERRPGWSYSVVVNILCQSQITVNMIKTLVGAKYFGYFSYHNVSPLFAIRIRNPFHRINRLITMDRTTSTPMIVIISCCVCNRLCSLDCPEVFFAIYSYSFQ